ncbi:MAG: hypothetical protein K0R51_2947 [Cytophagaceae bacterium]|jgi:hypothetical protein|nr:hypothetical protein [Cytophagaceae bacterium]
MKKRLSLSSIFLTGLLFFSNESSKAQTWVIPTNSSVVGSTTNNVIGTSNSGTNTNYFSIKSGGNEKMRFSPGGGIGVGLSGFPSGWSSNVDLEVFNNGWPIMAVSGMISSVKTNLFVGLATDNTGGWLNPVVSTGDGIITPTGGSAQDLVLSSSTTNNGMIRFTTGSTLTERLTIKDNGNVLINFGNTPACNLPSGAVLGVNGSIYATGIKVELSNSSGSSLCFPDYVFAKNYKLTPLAELESYINQNKHLPGIHSASEVEANGLDMVEMEVKLLEKIEELTLYLIETNKKIEALQNENKELKTLIQYSK